MIYQPSKESDEQLKQKAVTLNKTRMCRNKGYLGDQSLCGNVIMSEKDICGYDGDGFCAKMLKAEL